MFKRILVVLTFSVLTGCVSLWRTSEASITSVFDLYRDVERIQLSADGNVRLSAYAGINVRRDINASVVDEDIMDVDCQVAARKVTLIQGLYKDAPDGQLYTYHKSIKIRITALKIILSSYVFQVTDEFGRGDSPYSPKRLHVKYKRSDKKRSNNIETDSVVRFERPFDEIWYQIVKQRIDDNIEDRFYFPTNDIWCAESPNRAR